MMNHPPTDEMCEQITDTIWRASADWQLERVIEWLETELEYDPELANTRPYIHLDLKEAMRPQQQEDGD